METKRGNIIRAITFADEIHVYTTIIETYERREIFMRNFEIYFSAEEFFEEIYTHVEKSKICGIIFVMGNTLRPSFMDSYPFRVECRNYCSKHNIPIAFTCFKTFEMQAALHTSKIPIHELKNGETVTVTAKIFSTTSDLILCLPMRYENKEFQVLPTFLYFNPDIKSKEFQEDFIKFTKSLKSEYYIVVYPDEESSERYRKVFSSNEMNPIFIERWDKDVTTKVDMEVTLHKLGLKNAAFSVNYCPVVFKAVYGDKILFTSEEKYPMEKSCVIEVNPNMTVKHEIYQKGWAAVIFTREISLKSFTSSKAKVTMEVDKDLCFKFSVQQL